MQASQHQESTSCASNYSSRCTETVPFLILSSQWSSQPASFAISWDFAESLFFDDIVINWLCQHRPFFLMIWTHSIHQCMSRQRPLQNSNAGNYSFATVGIKWGGTWRANQWPDTMGTDILWHFETPCACLWPFIEVFDVAGEQFASGRTERETESHKIY